VKLRAQLYVFKQQRLAQHDHQFLLKPNPCPQKITDQRAAELLLPIGEPFEAAPIELPLNNFLSLADDPIILVTFQNPQQEIKAKGLLDIIDCHFVA
jgi:hypothetical protein